MRQRLKLTLLVSALLLPLFLAAQNTPVINATVSGSVVDATTNKRLVGATVAIKGTTNGATTNDEGQFTLITGQTLPFTVIVSYIGYKTSEVVLSNNNIAITLNELPNQLADVVITSRRREETAQAVPIPISIVGGAQVADAGAFNVNRLKELIPSVQLYSSNPRNTGLNIRGLGSSFGLTNDGIDPGVGFYVDGVYYARPAATTLDFIDVERIEVLRGPQGTLFGKNTTAGAFNVTTRKPSFSPGGIFELSYGNYGFVQAKTSITGPLSKKIAGRLSFSGTQRDGLLYNVATQQPVNDLNNLGVRGQLLILPSDKVAITLIGDATRQRPNGYAQVFAGVAPTLRPGYRQFEQIIRDLNYQLPSRNPFDRLIDHDTPSRSNNDLGGVSVNVDVTLGSGTITSTSAWRYWNWDPSNDRDFTGLQALRLSQATSKQQQWSQEVRWSGTLSPKLSGVFGLFAFGQLLDSNPVHIEESGNAQWRFSQSSTSALWRTAGLFDGYGIRTTQHLNTFSGAVFGQVDWAITDRLSLLPGIRYNYDTKSIDFNRQTYGGLQTTDPALLALKNSVYSNQAFNVNADNTNLSGQLTLAYKASTGINTFATYSTGYKPVGLNLGGLPTGSNGAPLLDLAVIKPELVNHVEVGIKTNPTPNSRVNVTLYNTAIRDYQTLVQSPEVGVNRGYLANAEQVRVRGVEVDGNLRVNRSLSLYGAASYTDGHYISFRNAPLPLEETGKTIDGVQVAFKDVSGGLLPGISKWATSAGGELTRTHRFINQVGELFLAIDTYYRSSFSSSPSPSAYLNIDGYALLNARAGFRAAKGTTVFLWGRNLTNTNYFEQLLPGAGNAGHYAAVLGDQRTYGITLRHTL